MNAGLWDVLPSTAALLEVPGMADRLGLRERLGDVRRIAVLLVDGLGYHLLPRAAEHAPVIADVLAGRSGTLDELCCAFPSTTPTSLVTLGTGTRPGDHGVLGFTVNIPGTDQLLTHVSWRDDPPPRQWQPVPTVLERAMAAGVAVSVVSRPQFEGSGLTIAAYGQPRFVGAERSAILAERMLAELAAGQHLVYGYHPSLDTASHVHGIASPQWARAAAGVDRLVGRIVAGLPSDAALLVTADHGALDVPTERRIDIADDPRLAAGLRVVAGEPRARYLHTVDGAEQDVLAAWREVLGARADVLSRDEAIARDMFGPVRPEHLARIGDVVVVCAGDTIVLATGHEPDTVGRLVAYHGSTTAVETAVPLISFRP